MKIFLADGRLGNQIFQYVFLKTVQDNNENIIVSGFEDLREVFEINDIINLNKKNRLVRILLFKICKPILNLLTNKKVISSIVIKQETVLNCYKRESTTFDSIQGILKRITFIKLGFFQSEKFFDEKYARSLKFKEIYLTKSSELLNCIPNNCHKIFIHIRRNDYKNFTVCDKSALLPISYYKDQIEWFTQNKKNCFFIFLGDDAKFISEEFGYVENKMISSDHHFGIDLAIMTKCNSAILSPSSFGWWGSYLMLERDTVFAPKYWLGFRSKIEFQRKSVPSFSKQVAII